MGSEYFSLWLSTLALVLFSTLPAEAELSLTIDGINFHLGHLSKFTHGFRGKWLWLNSQPTDSVSFLTAEVELTDSYIAVVVAVV